MNGDDTVIALRGLSKSYSLEQRPARRLWEQLRGGRGHGPQKHALHDVDLLIRRGEVVGVIGRNGAGKSTLLQVVCGVLQPSAGRRDVRGRVAALLELGAGFNPELTGRENVRLNAPLQGLSADEIERRMAGIIEFAGIGEYVDQPVRSYSSGMFMRLAFSLATSVDPDILVIDEALSVGDGAFARKSFERIMALKDRGTTILFCSHSMFQVESLCRRAIWIEDGCIRFDGPAHEATVQYTEWLSRTEQGMGAGASAQRFDSPSASITAVELVPPRNGARFQHRSDDLELRVAFASDPEMPCPTLGIVVHGADGRSITSAGNWVDATPLQRDAAGRGRAVLRFPQLRLLKGRYTVSVYVLCDRSVHVHAVAEHVLALEVEQDHLEQGVVSLPHEWQVQPGP